jgi:hypothetical protein
MVLDFHIYEDIFLTVLKMWIFRNQKYTQGWSPLGLEVESMWGSLPALQSG